MPTDNDTSEVPIITRVFYHRPQGGHIERGAILPSDQAQIYEIAQRAEVGSRLFKIVHASLDTTPVPLHAMRWSELHMDQQRPVDFLEDSGATTELTETIVPAPRQDSVLSQSSG